MQNITYYNFARLKVNCFFISSHLSVFKTTLEVCTQQQKNKRVKKICRDKWKKISHREVCCGCKTQNFVVTLSVYQASEFILWWWVKHRENMIYNTTSSFINTSYSLLLKSFFFKKCLYLIQLTLKSNNAFKGHLIMR